MSFSLVGTPARSASDDPVLAPTVPVMSIKIFNDDPNNHYIFPVLTTGKGDVDIWLQAIFRVPKARETIDTYGRSRNYRIYINDLAGIAPGKSVTLTVPLYTKLAGAIPARSLI